MHIFNSLALMARNETNKRNDHSIAEESSNLIVVFEHVDTLWKSELVEINGIKHFQGVIVIGIELGAIRLLSKNNLKLSGGSAFHTQNYIKAVKTWQLPYGLKLAITKDDCHSLSDSHLIVPALSKLFDQSDLNSDNCLHRLEILCFPEYLKRYFSG